MSQEGSGSVEADTSTLVVAVDGVAGSGKSSAAKGVARRLGLRYLDTGAMYRAMTWWILQRGVALDDPEAIAATVAGAGEAGPALEIGTDPDVATVLMDGTDVSAPIRTREVSAAVSAVSAVPLVRERMVRRQRALIGTGGIVVEGRDIGSTVAPDAQLKLYLTAAPEERARRRSAELAGGTTEVSGGEVQRTQADLARRDRLDAGRTASPMTRADGAVELDTTALDLDQVIDAISELAIESARPVRG